MSKFLSFAPPGHYYSPLPDYDLVQTRYDTLVSEAGPSLPGIETNDDGQLALLEQLSPFAGELPFTESATAQTRYYYDNQFFVCGDAIVAAAMLRHHRPRRIIEIGSGYSSAVMLDVIERYLPDCSLVCVEPDTSRLRQLLKPGDLSRFRLVENTLDGFDDTEFDALQANDLLFIDSSHVAKIGSDVSRLVFEVLPRLAPGVLVHVHDIFWPFEYPRAWYAEGRAWNEGPFLRSFLMFNQGYRIEYFNDFMARFHASDVARLMPRCLQQPGGSLWLRRQGDAHVPAPKRRAPRAVPTVPTVQETGLEAFRAEIDRFNASQPNAPLLDAIRAYNHQIVNALDGVQRLEGRSVLDVGASPHGYALERALALGAATYMGIGLDVDAPLLVRGPSGVGQLQNQDAEALAFPDESFDLLLSMSTFEHVAHVDRVLREMWRVLKPGGRALASFEPVWTCSYGHHLHHFGPVSNLVPDWAHLVWSKEEMLKELAHVWPADAPLSLASAVEWVYDGPAINRIGIVEMREYFQRSPFTVDWCEPLRDSGRGLTRARAIARTVHLTEDDLMTKGLSVLLTKA